MEDNLKILFGNISNIDDILLLEKEYPFEQYSKKTIEESLLNPNYINIIIYENDCPIGYLSANIQFDDCDLIKIIVSASKRRCGYGVRLINCLVSRLKKNSVKNVFLEVRKDNLPAIGLYNKVGFKKINERQKYYRDGMDAEIYRLEIND